MSRQVSPSTDKIYGLQRVARLWGVSRATLYRHRRPASVAERKRPGPRGATSDDDLVAAIRELLQDSPFHGEGHRKLWARLRFAGVRTSRRRVLRLMREHGLLAHQRVGAPHGSKAHDGRITTERVDLMWGTDLTSVMTGEGQAGVFVAVDHCSAECVGIHASRSADRFQALEPVKQAVRQGHGGFAKGIAAGLRPRAGRERLRRALHPGLEGEPVVGPPLRHRRRVALGTPRLPADLQPVLDHRAARLPDTRPGPGRTSHGPAHGRLRQSGVSELWTGTQARPILLVLPDHRTGLAPTLELGHEPADEILVVPLAGVRKAQPIERRGGDVVLLGL